MRSLQNISTLYFIGIGGIGMSALARYCKLLGKEVSGYDKTQTTLTDQLTEENIQITYTDAVSELPASLSKEETLVVYTPAIPKNNTILNWFRDHDYEIVKRAQLLGSVTRDTLCLAVAGTHGKTTTSAILGHLLAACDMPVTAFLGGIAENYNSNFIHKGNEITVVEADEFDRSFLQLHPDIACITSMDADHLDIYGDGAQLIEAFTAFSELLPNKENVLIKNGLPIKGKTIGINDNSDFEARNVRVEDGQYVFDLVTPKETISELRFSLPGHHNLLNAVTALGMAILAGSPTARLPKALSDFNGVERRFSYKIRTNELVLIDDYAHHPTEINALHQAVEELYPEEEKLIVFQPHLFSRTKDFADGFAESLSRFDEILLLDIYPARELPIDGVNSEWLLKKINSDNKALISKDEIAEKLASSECKIKLMVGAGDIGAEVEKVQKSLMYEA